MATSSSSTPPLLAKWGLFLRVVPLTALFALAKFAVHHLGWEPWAFDSLTGSLFGSATFVIAFVLSGTLGIYNASEDMMVQLVNAIETLEDINLVSAAGHPQYDANPLRLQLAALLKTIDDWLRNVANIETLERELTSLNSTFAALGRLCDISSMNRCLGELARIRILVTRMQINRGTTFLGPAYAMLEVFLAGAVVALLLIGAERFSEGLVVSCFLFTSFTYLLLLIRDLDNPFQYDGSSSVDVDLSLLETTRSRLLGRAS
jgi:hypothetical protein